MHFCAIPTRMLIVSTRLEAYSPGRVRRASLANIERDIHRNRRPLVTRFPRNENRIIERAAPGSVVTTAERLMSTHT